MGNIVYLASSTGSVYEPGLFISVCRLWKPSVLTCTVDYTTEAVNATTADYTTTSGTLTFVPDDIEEVIEIPILSSFVFEHQFKIKLSNPTNAVLGTVIEQPATQLVTIDATGWFVTPQFQAPGLLV